MKMKKVLLSLASFTFAALMALTSCTKEEPTPGPEPTPEPGKEVLTLEKTAYDLPMEQPKLMIKAQGLSDYSTAEWSLDKEGIVDMVINEGKASATVSPVAVGEVNITVKVGDQSASAKITVKKAAEPKPEVPLPGAGKIGFLLQIPADVNVCNTVGMVGGFQGYDPNAAVLMEKKAEGWYYCAIDKVGANDFGNSKFVLMAEDGTSDWKFEVKAPMEVAEESAMYCQPAADFGTEGAVIKLVGEVDNVNIVVYAKQGFKSNPCASTANYKITLKMAYVDAEGATGYQPAVSGDMNTWGVDAMTKVSDTEWTYDWADAREGANFKFQSTEGGWQNQIQEFVISEENPEGEWKDLQNIALTSDLNPVFDFTDPAKYKWSKAGTTAVTPNPAGEVTVTVKATNLPEGAALRVVGNIAEDNNWNVAVGQDLAFDEAAGVFKATFTVLEKFQFKILWATDGNFTYDQCAIPDQNNIMDDSMASSLEISEWKGVPAPVE